jgi:uncharacterized protein (UPF0548 family)
MIRVRRPAEDDLGDELRRCASQPLTYAPIGVSLSDDDIGGLRRHSWHASFDGVDAFDVGKDAIRAWEIHRGAGLVVAADGPIAEGTNVVMSAPMPIGFVDVACRIVVVIDEPDRFGFAYGTLPMHPERGEESFVLTRTGFEVRAASAHVNFATRMIPALGDRLQDAAVKRYLEAMSRVAVR